MSITAMSAFCDLSSAIMPVHLIRSTMKMMIMAMIVSMTFMNTISAVVKIKKRKVKIAKMTVKIICADHEENKEHGCHMTEWVFLQEKVATPNL